MALEDPSVAAVVLRNAATGLRAIEHLGDPALIEVHRRFSLSGVGEAFFTKWFGFAGFVPERDWQPLILDSRVRATLNKTLSAWLNRLTEARNDPHRYVACLTAMHRWAAALPQPMSATRLEWIMFTHNGAAV